MDLLEADSLHMGRESRQKELGKKHNTNTWKILDNPELWIIQQSKISVECQFFDDMRSKPLPKRALRKIQVEKNRICL